MNLSLRYTGLLAVCCVAMFSWTACAPIPETASPGVTASPFPDTSTPPTNEISSPAPTLGPIQIPINMPDSTQAVPLLESSLQLTPLGWSPDGAWLVYHEYDPRGSSVSSDVLLNRNSGVTCTLAEAASSGMQTHTHPNWEWQADGKLLIVEQDTAEIREPCQPSGQDITDRFISVPVGITSASPNRRLFLIETGAGDAIYDSQLGEVLAVQPAASGLVARGISWSPDSKHYAVIGYPDFEHANAGTVRIVEASSGRLVTQLDMQLWGIDSSFPPPIWLTNDQILVRRTIDLGPFLMSLDGTVTRIIPTLVDVTVSSEGGCAPQCVGVLTDAFGSAGIAGSSHVILNAAQPDSMPFLYHFETLTSEKLQLGGYRFSPDGQWLWFLQAYQPLPTGLWLRPVDPSGSAALPIDLGVTIASPNHEVAVFDWSANSQVFAVGLAAPPHDVIMYSVPDGREVARWSLGNYIAAASWSLDWAWIGDGVWSPNGRTLLLRAEPASNAGTALFLLTVP